MSASSTTRPTEPDITTVNRQFYDALWSKAQLQRPDRFNTWPLVSELLPQAPARLEIGPGLRPRLPVLGTHFIDLSEPAVTELNARGGIAAPGQIGALPFDDQRFDLVCALDIIEHVEDDNQAFSEISRVVKDDGTVILSVPVHPDRWNAFDRWVGHVRRYDPSALPSLLAGYEKWRAPFLDEQGGLREAYRPAPMLASFMPDAAGAAGRRAAIPVPKGPVDVW